MIAVKRPDNRSLAGEWRAFAIPPLCALAACGDSALPEEASGTIVGSPEIADSPETAIMLEPGLWEWTLRPEPASFEGPETEEQADVQRQLNRPIGDTLCLGPEQAAHPGPRTFQGTNGEDGCRYSGFSMGDGEISYQGRCEGDAGSGTTHVEGTYTAVSYDLTVRATIEEGPAGRAGMTGRITGRRTGECEADLGPGS